MKPDPQQYDPADNAMQAAIEHAFDPGLLDEALAQPASESLEHKVLALTDPQMLSLLDEALRVEAPKRLNEKIIEKTLAATAASNTNADRADNPSAPPVLARIGLATPRRYAAAAAIALAAGAALWFGIDPLSPTGSPSGNLANRDNNTTAPDTDRLEDLTFDQTPALFTDATGRVETELRALSETLDANSIDRNTIWSDMDAYEQFLSDIESDLG